MTQILKGLSMIVAVGGIILTPIVIIAIWAPLFGVLSLFALKEVIATYLVVFVLFAALTLSAHVTRSFAAAGEQK